jgi:small subunit ribosomal protein S8
MLTRIRNAVAAGHRELRLPASSVKRRIAEILKQEGFISDYAWEDDSRQATLQIGLKWQGTQAAIEGLQRVSRPGQRQYARCDQIPKVRNGLGIMIVSTSRGIMTDRAARKAGVGGELVCSVW